MSRTSLGDQALQMFVDAYEEHEGKEFNVNYGMIVMAGRIAKFYDKKQISRALNAFFESTMKKDFYTFVDNIDRLVVAYEKDKESKREFEDLKKKTTRTVKSIHKKKVG